MKRDKRTRTLCMK